MAKNPFKKKNITDTVINTAIGGAGNVLFDTVWGYLPVDMTSQVSSTVKNAIKLVGGAIAGSMTSNKYLRAAADGFAVVGASDLVSDLINSKEENTTPKTTEGLPSGTIGATRIPRYGSRQFRRAAKASGRMAGLEDFMAE